jgi:N-acetylmuramoyl-L-alanine amidase
LSKKKRAGFIGLTLFLSYFFLINVAFPFFNSSPSYLRVAVKDEDNFTRVIFSSDQKLSSSIERSGTLLLIHLRLPAEARFQKEPFTSRLVRSIGWAKNKETFLLTIQVRSIDFTYESFTLKAPPRLIIDIYPPGELKSSSHNASSSSAPDPGTPAPSFAPELNKSNLSSAIKTIVIDPGHGGTESGARGKLGSLEKDITLDIALKLKEIISRNMAYRVVLTREEDIDIPLDTRAAIANNNRADLFVSIHVNSSYRQNARGSEVFFLSLNATDEEARRLAYLENNSSELDQKIADPENEEDIKMILWDMAQTAYLKQSSLLAERIQQELNSLLNTANRGIKQAPFKVLTGVACPAVLVEVAFISNEHEERKLLTEEFQIRVAEAIYRGIQDFLRAFSPQSK